MDMGEFSALIERALSAKQVLSAYVHCAIVYSGRAETELPRGDRLVIIKADGSVLVHQPEGTMPINYMKGGSQVALERSDDHLLLNSYNPKEKAWLEIEIFRVHAALAHALEDGAKLQLAGNEEDLSDWIRDNPACISNDFRPIAREEQTDVGFIDVYGHDGNGGIVVIECKRVTASLSAVDQLRRYVERVKAIKGTEQVSGVLAAPAITSNAQAMLESWGYRFCAIDPPRRLERWRKDQRSLVDF